MNPKKERAKLAITNVSRVSQGRFLSDNNKYREPASIKLDSIISHAWQLKRNGRAEETIGTAINRLKSLTKLCDISDPEQVKSVLATIEWKNSTKHGTATIYTHYLKHIGKTWTPPKYTEESTLPFIPTEAEIDILIAAGTLKTATLLQILKETGARIGEIAKTKWTNIDTERKTIYITAEKGSNNRILPITNKLIAMLNALPKINDKVFQPNKHSLRVTFEGLRNRTATKLNNPRLKQIHFHTFRHWKATMEYHKTKDIIHVKTMLGHKSIESTMTYINIEQSTFTNQSDEWTCKIANNIKEATDLIEAGFEYITDMDSFKLFRKRK
jgi:integrase/recombinase XerD